MIPKDSTVLAQRLPAAAPGKGRAARYVSGRPPVNSRAATAAAAAQTSKAMDMEKAQTEEERLKAMFSLGQAQWQQKQEEMSHDTRVPISGMRNSKKNVPEGDPPQGYVCYRCGKKGTFCINPRLYSTTNTQSGHWIQACPTNDDANYDNRNRIKRTTGIPRSMLKKIDPEDVDKLDDEQRQKLMVNAEGEYVFAQADEKEWRKHLERVKANEQAQKEANSGNKELQERGLECSIDKRMFVDPMKTPCCGKTYCHDCIENALIESDLTCPGCQTEDVSLERLEPDEDIKTKIKEYEDERKNNATAGPKRSESPAANVSTAGTPAAAEAASSRGSKSPSAATSRKRKDRGDDDEDKEIDTANINDALSPSAPEMKRQKSSDSAQHDTKEDDEASTTLKNSVNSSTAPPSVPIVPNMMPPDMATMMASMQNMPFPNMPLAMPGMMPFIPPMNMNMPLNMGMNPMMPMMQPNFANMGMNMNIPNMNAMNGANGVGGFPNMMGMNQQQYGFSRNQNQNFSQRAGRGGRGRGRGRGGFHNDPGNTNSNNRNFSHSQQQPPHKTNISSPMTGMAGVPTGPKGPRVGLRPRPNQETSSAGDSVGEVSAAAGQVSQGRVLGEVVE